MDKPLNYKSHADSSIMEAKGSPTKPPAKSPSEPEETLEPLGKAEQKERPSSPPNNTSDGHEPLSPPTSIPVSPTAKSNLGKYKLVRTIGKGNFAKVKLAIHMATGVEVAIKIITKKGLDRAANDRLRREVSILQTLNHPNIVRLLEIIENDNVVCLVQEYANGGEIFDYLVAHGKMREKEARSKFRQLVSAIDYCHSKGIVHRDLKAENILLDSQLNVKVADFGLANVFKSDQKLSTFCGSPPYAAPELFLGIRYYGPGVDIWSMGVLLFTLVVGHLPFDAVNLRKLRTKILTVSYNLNRGEVSNDLHALLKKMLVLDPRDRYSLQALMNDKWLNTGYAAVMTPYREPSAVQLNEAHVEQMIRLGFTEVDLMNSVVNPGFNHVYATYTLLSDMFKRQSNSIPQLEQTPKSSGCESSGASGANRTSPSGGGKAVGRFTVEPTSDHSGNSSRSGRRDSGPRHLHPGHNGASAAAGAAVPHHYSATSSLPSALKRALVNMGRSLTGQTSGGSNSLTAAQQSGGGEGRFHKLKDPQSRRSSSQSRQSSKSRQGTIHTNGHCITRGVHMNEADKDVPVTPAPVPLSTRQQKRMTSGATVSPPSLTAQSHNRGTRVPPVLMKAAQPPLSTSSAAPLQPPPPTNGGGTTNSPTQSTSATPPPELPGVTVTSAVAPPPKTRPASSSSTSDSQEQQHSQKPSNQQRKEKKSPKQQTTISREDTTLENEHSIDSGLATGVAFSVVNEVVHHAEEDLKSSQQASRPSDVVVVVLEGTNLGSMSSQLAVSDGVNAHCESGQRTPAPPTNAGAYLPPSKQASAPTQLVDGKHQIYSRPREVRSPWGVHVTSHKTPSDLIDEMKRALRAVEGCRWDPDPQWMYLLHCGWSEILSNGGSADEAVNSPASLATSSFSTTAPSINPLFRKKDHLPRDLLQWEMEVCAIPRLHLRAVCLKRIRGSAIQFQKIASQVMASMNP